MQICAYSLRLITSLSQGTSLMRRSQLYRVALSALDQARKDGLRRDEIAQEGDWP